MTALDGALSRPRPAATEIERRSLPTLWALGLYAVLSLVLFGLPVLGHLGSRIVASDPIDSSQFMWFFAWWPHALLHGLNPFVTHVMFVPEGFNLTWATAMPGPSRAALAGDAGLRARRDLERDPAGLAGAQRLDGVHAVPPPDRPDGAVAGGGYVFGFSPYMLIHLTGGPYLALVALVPVFVLLVIRRVQGPIGARAFVVAMALALAGQYLISSEVLATATLFGAVALVLAYALLPDRRAGSAGHRPAAHRRLRGAWRF